MAPPSVMKWTVPGTTGADDDGLGVGDGPPDEAAAAAAPDDALDSGGFYAALNVPRDADEEAVRRAYRGLAAACHPDKVAPDLREAAAEQFARLQKAYEVRC